MRHVVAISERDGIPECTETVLSCKVNRRWGSSFASRVRLPYQRGIASGTISRDQAVINARRMGEQKKKKWHTRGVRIERRTSACLIDRSCTWHEKLYCTRYESDESGRAACGNLRKVTSMLERSERNPGWYSSFNPSVRAVLPGSIHSGDKRETEI